MRLRFLEIGTAIRRRCQNFDFRRTPQRRHPASRKLGLACCEILPDMPQAAAQPPMLRSAATYRALRRGTHHLAARQQRCRTAATAADAAPDALTITRPDDWHLHVRDGGGLASVVPHSAATFGRAVIMPNLQPPVITVAQVIILMMSSQTLSSC